MLIPHYNRTKQRINESDAKYILAIQDQMYLNYSSHKAKSELGTISAAQHTTVYGLIQHSVLCVTDKNESLGLMDLEYFHNSEFDTTVHQDKRSLGEKTNKFWVDALKNMRERVGVTEKKIITVADRESDFFEFMHSLCKENEAFVIRSQHDRILGEKYSKFGEKLSRKIESSPVIDDINVEIQDMNTRELIEINLNLKAFKVCIPVPPKVKRKNDDYSFLKINVVIAYNKKRKWILFTSLPIEKTDQIKEIINIYKSRWHIEDFHKVLKTGHQVEEIFLHATTECIKNLLVMAAISACRLYWIIFKGRAEHKIKAEELFTEFEWKSVYVYLKEKIPKECPSIAEVIYRVARLGGYKPDDEGPPGTKALWIGYQRVGVTAQMYEAMSIKT